MSDYSGTMTEKNLLSAFADESQARNRYTYFASVARKEGYELIAELFQKTADNEKEHAELWFKELNGLGDTAANLRCAAENEHAEWSDLYARYAITAEEEGFHALSERFRLIAAIEKRHEERFRDLLRLLLDEQMFSRGSIMIWECRNCGHIVVGYEAPERCPACDHAQSYYQLFAKNY